MYKIEHNTDYIINVINLSTSHWVLVVLDVKNKFYVHVDPLNLPINKCF